MVVPPSPPFTMLSDLIKIWHGEFSGAVKFYHNIVNGGEGGNNEVMWPSCQRILSDEPWNVECDKIGKLKKTYNTR